MKLMLGFLIVALGLVVPFSRAESFDFSSAPPARSAYTCVFEVDQKVVKECNIDSASTSTAKCSYSFPGTNLTGACVVNRLGSQDLLACQIGVPGAGLAEPDFSRMMQSKNAADAIVALARLPGLAAAAATQAPRGKAAIHLGYVEKQGAPLFSAICPSTFGK